MNSFRAYIREPREVYSIIDGRTNSDYRTIGSTLAYKTYETNDDGTPVIGHRNYIKNPSFEANVDFWSVQSDTGTATMQRTDSETVLNAFGNTFCLRCHKQTAATYANIISDGGAATVTVPPGHAVRLSAYTNNTNGAEKPIVHIFAVGGGSPLVSNVSASAAGGSWRQSVVAWENTTGVPVGVFVVIDFFPVTGNTLIDMIMLEVATTIGDLPSTIRYFDGDHPNCFWTGISHASVSIRESTSTSFIGVPVNRVFPTNRKTDIRPSFFVTLGFSGIQPTLSEYEDALTLYMDQKYISIKSGSPTSNNDGLGANVMELFIIDAEGYRIDRNTRYIPGVHASPPSTAVAGVPPYIIDGFIIDTPMPSDIGAHATPDQFGFVSNIYAGQLFYSGTDNIMIDRQITNVTFSSEIHLGYSDCVIELANGSDFVGPLINNFTGRILDLQNTAGDLVWSGLISGIDINGLAANINCIGVQRTMEWVYMPVYLRDTTFTAPEIIEDLIKHSPWLRFRPHAIDPNGEWKEQQSVVLGGVGPVAFEEGQVTIAQALDEILARGYEGMPQDRSQNKIVLQTWNDRVPKIKEIKRTLTYSDVEYWIPNTALQANHEGVTYSSDITDTSTINFGMYQTEGGSTLPTPRAIDLNLLRYYNINIETILSGALNLGEFLNILLVAKGDKSKLSGPGQISVRGNIKSRGGSTMIPSYAIKAGMVVGVEGGVASYAPHESKYSNPVIFTVGSTSYDASSEVLSITIDRLEPLRDFLINRIQV